MKKSVLFGMLFLCSTFMNVFAASPLTDPATYATRFGYNLTSNWAYTNVLNNYVTSADLLGATNSVRGMAVKDGKMLFCSRNSGNQILVIDGATGAKLTPVTLASNVFTYLGRNKANTADSTWSAALACNDIQVDNAGNVLVSNLSTSNSSRFQIWKIDMSNGNGTAIIDETIISNFSASKVGTRFDAFGVWGDVTKNAVIMAASAEQTAMEVYKWTISNGIVSTPVLIELDNTTAGTTLSGKANVGYAPRVLPLDDNYFYIDGSATPPTLINKEGYVMDGFYKKFSALTDSITTPGAKLKMNDSNNGVTEFQVGNDYFLLLAATGYTGVPTSAFRLFKFTDANKLFSGLDVMWTLPQAGMGGAKNAYFSGVPAVEVTGNEAKIYLYAGEDGYARYTMSVATGVNNAQISNVNIFLNNNKVSISEQVKSAEIFSVNGQKVAAAYNVSELVAPTQKGIYLVSIIDKDGAKKVQKIAVQ